MLNNSDRVQTEQNRETPSPMGDAKMPVTLLPLLWHFIKPQKWLFFILTLTMTGWGIQEAVYPYFIKLIIDKMSHLTDKQLAFPALMPTILTFIVLWLLIELGYRVYDFLSGVVYPRFQANIRTQLFEYVLSHSHQFFSNQFAGSIGSKISRMADAMLSITTIFLSIFWPILIAFGISVSILYQAKPLFGVVLLSWCLLHFAITALFVKKSGLKSAAHSESVTLLNGKIIDALSNISNIRLFSRRRYELTYLSHYQDDEIKRSKELIYYNSIMKLFLGMAGIIFIFCMIIFDVYAFRENWITLGDFALIMSSLSLVGLAWYMGMHLIKIYEDIGTCREAMTLIQKAHDIIDKPNAPQLKINDHNHKGGEIIFDNVTFHYSKHRNLFKGKTITLRAGEKVGLVGFSGSGKTTFVNLILRMFDVESGRILIDNQDIRDVTQDSIREHISLIPQDTTLFHRTLMENIRYGKLTASDAEVIEASKKAHCHEFIEQLEFGYNTLVGERGIKLSGGQRQRIAIARAILKDAAILILDEATSSLDSITEKYIQDGLNYLMQQRTTIVIAHRLSTLSNMDRILVFKEGQIIEDGSHYNLLAMNGHYAQLWNMQAGGFLPD